jgi:hypothetical protein
MFETPTRSFISLAPGFSPVWAEQDIQAVLTASCGRKTVVTVFSFSIACSPG